MLSISLFSGIETRVKVLVQVASILCVSWGGFAHADISARGLRITSQFVHFLWSACTSFFTQLFGLFVGVVWSVIPNFHRISLNGN